MGVRKCRFIRIRSNHSDLFQPGGIQRQDVFPIFKQNDGFPRCLQGDLVVFGTIHLAIRRLIIQLVGLIEKPDQKFHAKNIPNPVVNHLHRDAAFPHQFTKR